MLNFREAPSFKSIFAADGAYQVLKPMTVNGVQLDRGDALPLDSPMRRNPYRLQQLCEQNRMVPVLSSGPPGPSPQKTYAEAPAPAPPVTPEPAPTQVKAALVIPASIMSLPMRDLQRMLKERALNHVGNKGQLRKRLAIALAG